MLTPDSTASDDLLTQLIDAAENITSEADSSCDVSYPSDLIETGYESERTDFLEDTPSPSVRRHQITRRQSAAMQSHQFRIRPQPLTSRPVARLLDFARGARRRAPRSPRSSRSTSGALERTPSHRYTADERELLCVLHRFYHSYDKQAVPKIFNAITGLQLRHHTIQNYFTHHMCLYGPESFRVFSHVLSIPFDQPEGNYAEIFSAIKQYARDMDLKLHRRTVEPKFASGKARKSNSPQIRQIYKLMVKTVKQEVKDEVADARIIEEVAEAARTLNVMSRARRIVLCDDNDELFEDVEQGPVPVTNSMAVPKLILTKPNLVFRVWDEANRTRFVNGNFVAQTFVNWPRPFPAPIALDDPSNAGKILAVLHLSKQGDTPVYISTASVSAYSLPLIL